MSRERRCRGIEPLIWIKLKGCVFDSRQCLSLLSFSKTLYPHCCSPSRCMNKRYPIGCERHLSLDVACARPWIGVCPPPQENTFNFNVCVVGWCSDGSINSQFWDLFGRNQDIYNWISRCNKPSDRRVNLTHQSIGDEYAQFGHLSIFNSLKHLLMLF